MSNTIYRQILYRKIEEFANLFEHTSNAIFKNRDGKLIHPGEYGMYKEKAFRQLLKLFLSRDFSVSDGFVITANDTCSTQCDIVIYDSSTAPLIQSNLTQFFPIEIVRGICEIKSTLDKKAFKEALIKLSKIKAMSEELYEDFANDNCMRNWAYIPTFLVCDKLDFKLDSLNFDEIYGDIPRKFWHNSILSIKDGLIQYKYEVKDLGPKTLVYRGLDTPADLVNSIDCGYAILEYCYHGNIHETLETTISFESDTNDYEHVFTFLADMDILVQEHEYFEFDNCKYLGLDYKPGAVNIRKPKSN